MRQKHNNHLFLVVFLIITAIGLRLLPHPANFAPIAALALFGGAYLKIYWSYILPVAAMLLSDALIGFYSPMIMASVYLAFVISVFLGSLAKKEKSISKIVVLTLSGSIIFFLTTNFAVWAFTPMYKQTISGLVSCYIAALPFFRNTVLGDLFYVGVFFGSYEIISLFLKKKTAAATSVIPAD